LPEHKLRVVAPDVGGGFGSKIYHYAEEAAVTWAAGQLGRAVKWTAERAESFISDAQGRDHVTHAELALDKDGKFLAMRVATLANLGAYLSTFAPAVPTYLYATLLAGTYTTPAIYAEVKGVFTNTVPVDAYRGAGRPEASYLVERLVGQAAREMKLDPVDIRRRNFIGKDAYPYQTPVALAYDSGDYFTTLDMALRAADYAGFEQRRAAAARQGKLRGIGLASYIEACGVAPSAVAGALGARAGLYEVGAIRVNPTGSVTVLTGTHSHGQSHETTFAQLVSERLGVPIENIDVVHGDTARIPFGMGTYGSRSLPVGGSALVKALDKVVNKGRKIAAHLLEAAEADIEFKDGKFTVAGTDRSKAFGEVAFAAYVPHNYPLDELEPGLDETAYYDPKNFTFPSGTHICEVEIDRDTGQVRIVNFIAADDFGRIINPMVVEGQVHGGLAQGIGQALCENCEYDRESGQLLTGSFMDYCMPRADILPNFSVETHGTLCTHNPLGVKGCGEAGAIGAPGAVMNAVQDALAPLGVGHVDMPATPERIWRAMAARPAAKAA
jgi:carbon-monoxide dehydrogenase large subunit